MLHQQHVLPTGRFAPYLGTSPNEKFRTTAKTDECWRQQMKIQRHT